MTAANVLWNLHRVSVETVGRIRIPANQIQLLADFAGVYVELSVPVGVVDGDGIGGFLVEQTQHASFMARKDFLDLFAGGKTVNRTVFTLWNGRLAGGSVPFHIAFRPFPFARNRQAFKAAKILTVIGKQKCIIPGEHSALNLYHFVGLGDNGSDRADFSNLDHAKPSLYRDFLYIRNGGIAFLEECLADNVQVME